MPAVRNGGAKWKNRTALAGADYKQGVANPRRQWQEATSAAADNWTQGVQEAAANNRFAKGVSNAGQQAYTNGVTKKANRFVDGVNISGDAYDKGFAPYKSTIEATQLPPRGRRGSPENYQRVVQMGTALNNKRKELLGGS